MPCEALIATLPERWAMTPTRAGKRAYGHFWTAYGHFWPAIDGRSPAHDDSLAMQRRVTLARMASSTDRVRRLRARRAAGITAHACPQCGVSHYPETPVTHACPQCGLEHAASNAPLHVTPVAPTGVVSHDGQGTILATPVAPTGQPCQRCELARTRLAEAIAAGNVLRERIATLEGMP